MDMQSYYRFNVPDLAATVHHHLTTQFGPPPPRKNRQVFPPSSVTCGPSCCRFSQKPRLKNTDLGNHMGSDDFPSHQKPFNAEPKHQFPGAQLWPLNPIPTCRRSHVCVMFDLITEGTIKEQATTRFIQGEEHCKICSKIPPSATPSQ